MEAARPVTRPLATIAAGGNHHGLVTTDNPTNTDVGDVANHRFRMLQPREQLAAQAFPADYIVHGNRTQQTAQAGNAVSVNVAAWLGQQIAEVL